MRDCPQRNNDHINRYLIANPFWWIIPDKHLRAGVDILMGLDIQDAPSPFSGGSLLTDTKCWWNSGLISRCSLKASFLFSLSDGFLSDMSASTLKGRHDTCAPHLFSRGGCSASAVGTSPLQSSGEHMLFFFWQNEIWSRSRKHTRRSHGEKLGCYLSLVVSKVDKVGAGKTLGSTRDWSWSRGWGWGGGPVRGRRVWDARNGTPVGPHPQADSRSARHPFSDN